MTAVGRVHARQRVRQGGLRRCDDCLHPSWPKSSQLVSSKSQASPSSNHLPPSTGVDPPDCHGATDPPTRLTDHPNQTTLIGPKNKLDQKLKPVSLKISVGVTANSVTVYKRGRQLTMISMAMAMTMAMAMANILARVTANSVTVYKRGRQLTIIPNSDRCLSHYVLWSFSLSISGKWP